VAAAGGTLLSEMRPVLPCAAAAAILLTLTACGGGGVSGDTPSGFTTTEVHGASVAHPKDLRARPESKVGQALMTELAPAGSAALPSVDVLYEAGGAKRFKSLPDQYKAVYESADDGEVTSVKAIDVDGADGAYLMKARLPAGGGRKQPYDVQNLQVRRGDDSWVVIVRRDASHKDALDADAVIGSFHFGGGA
jgi:hypothetical protein